MGLDMYLTANRYLADYKDADVEVQNQINEVPNLNNAGLKVKNVSCSAAYWRKANAIHKWFVDNVQDGVDDCKEYYVTIENLKALIEVCNKVLEDNSLANTLLPPQEGFFFGSTDVDEWYLGDLVYTKETLTKLVENLDPKQWDFYYQSSW